MERIMFVELDDVKEVMLLLAKELDSKQKAVRMLQQMGMPINSGSMAHAREDTRNTAVLLLATQKEFRRLHPGCDCGTTDEEIAESITDLESLIDMIDVEEAEAGPVTYDRSQEIQALGEIIGQLGGGMFPGGGIPENGAREQRLGSDGIGLYL